jgi:hypothetical protein
MKSPRRTRQWAIFPTAASQQGRRPGVGPVGAVQAAHDTEENSGPGRVGGKERKEKKTKMEAGHLGLHAGKGRAGRAGLAQRKIENLAHGRPLIINTIFLYSNPFPIRKPI